MQLFFKNGAVATEQADLGNTSGSAVALGEFDAVHLAHTEIVKKVVDYADENGLISLVYMFSNNPLEVIKGRETEYINSLDKRIEILFSMGVDVIAVQKFDKDMMMVSPENFVREYLVDKLNAKFAVAGYNYRFGKDGSGDINTLEKLCQMNGIKVCYVPEVTYLGERVSSSKIRELIASGDVLTASEFMGRYYSLDGEVVCGNHIGGELIGFPTANIEIPKGCTLPKYGVYISRTTVDGKAHPSITNIGTKPTVSDNGVCIETHIDASFGELYGKRIEVELCDFIREIEKFNSVEELSVQLEEDRMKMRSFFENIRRQENEKF